MSPSVLVLLGAMLLPCQTAAEEEELPALAVAPGVAVPGPASAPSPAAAPKPGALPPAPMLDGLSDAPPCPCPRKYYWESTCDMPPHYAYYPIYHGYFSFKPYNFCMVLRQQQTVVLWGLDPRIPYATTFFQKFYLERGITGNVRAEAPDEEPRLPSGVKPLPRLDEALRPQPE